MTIPTRVIYTNHSPKIQELADLTLPNKGEYSTRHGLDLYIDVIDYQLINGCLLRLRQLLQRYDLVMLMGCDAVFTNMTIAIDAVLQPFDRVVIGTEKINPDMPVNNDVMLWTNHPDSLKLLDEIISSGDKWKDMYCMWQGWIAANLARYETPNGPLRLTEPNVMNSSPWMDYPGVWRQGDWIFHAFGGTIEQKLADIKAVLPLVRR